jgi:hypothetical protein
LDSIKSRTAHGALDIADFRAKYYGFWQGDKAKLVYTMQRLTLYVLIALAIASGVEGASYDNPSSVAVASNLAKAYSIICTSLLRNLAHRRYFPPHG